VLLIVGLGNPGRQYEHTRHNVGFMVMDALADRHRAAFKPGRGEYWRAQCSVRGADTLLVKPATFMNNSGIAVQAIIEEYDLRPHEILVVFDDFQIPLGRIRIRPSGSDGGHHGLESIIYHLQTDQVPRLRCGIAGSEMEHGRDGKIDFVLAPFTESELPDVRRLIGRAADAVEVFIAEGLAPAMNRFNTKEE
jgi:peptidyl-tRNA hydrolase, PTH1 family